MVGSGSEGERARVVEAGTLGGAAGSCGERPRRQANKPQSLFLTDRPADPRGRGGDGTRPSEAAGAAGRLAIPPPSASTQPVAIFPFSLFALLWVSSSPSRAEDVKREREREKGGRERRLQFTLT